MLTLGEKRVRTDFNATGSSEITEAKTKAAELINLVNSVEHTAGDIGEFKRLQALAMTAIEEASMWHVKLLTL